MRVKLFLKWYGSLEEIPYERLVEEKMYDVASVLAELGYLFFNVLPGNEKFYAWSDKAGLEKAIVRNEYSE